MTRSQFFTIIIVLSVVFVFIKIYQHNLLIKLNYEKQRLINKKNELKNKRNELLVKLFYLNNYERVKKISQQDLKLQPLKLSQIIIYNPSNFEQNLNKYIARELKF